MRLSRQTTITPQYQYYGIWMKDRKEWLTDESGRLIAFLDPTVVGVQIDIFKAEGHETKNMEVRTIGGLDE